MKTLKIAIVVSSLAFTSVAFAQSVAPQAKPAKSPAPAAGTASGGQTSGAGAVTSGSPIIGAMGFATIAIAAAGALIVAVANRDDGVLPAVTH